MLTHPHRPLYDFLAQFSSVECRPTMRRKPFFKTHSPVWSSVVNGNVYCYCFFFPALVVLINESNQLNIFLKHLSYRIETTQGSGKNVKISNASSVNLEIDSLLLATKSTIGNEVTICGNRHCGCLTIRSLNRDIRAFMCIQFLIHSIFSSVLENYPYL